MCGALDTILSTKKKKKKREEKEDGQGNVSLGKVLAIQGPEFGHLVPT